MLPLDAVHDGQGLVSRAATRAIGDGTEIGLELHQRRDGLFHQGAFALVCFGGKEFKGDHRSPGQPRRRKDVSDKLHGGHDEWNGGQFNPAFA